MRAASKDTSPEIVKPGSPEAAIIEAEQETLAEVQKQIATEELGRVAGTQQYDRDLIALRDQISEARIEDVAPLVAEMYRMQALGAANGKGRDLPVDAKSPYFGHLRLNDGKKTRDVLIGSRGFVRTGQKVAIVDWRNAPVSRIYYCYDEGDDYEENFGGRLVSGIVEARRTVSIVDGELRRVSWSEGAVARQGDGAWVHIPASQRPVLKGGAGTAARPPAAHHPPLRFKPGRLGVVGDEALREDKHLKEITALIDPAQFDMITRDDSGIVILQGGAGSGKTTVALHRAAYLHFNSPHIYTSKKMAVVVKSAPLTEYISRVLPSLDVKGTPVVTLEGWMNRTRRQVFPDLKRAVTQEVPPTVARLKKHPAILAMLDKGVAAEAADIGEELVRKADGQVKKVVGERWRGLCRYALLPRIREMTRWIEGGAAMRAGLSNKGKAALLGVLRRARPSGGDVLATWAQLLTDRELLRETLKEKASTSVAESEIDELVRWVSMQDDDSQTGDDDNEEPDREDREARAEAQVEVDRHLAGRRDRSDGGGGGGGLDPHVGIDGRRIDDGSPIGKLDENDDALILRLTQLKYGGLPIARSNKTVTYEHLIVDEAQDLSPTDIAVLRGTLTKRESMTLAGDTAQKLIFDNGFDTWEGMLEDIGVTGVKIDQLRISYRSTKEVVDFARAVLGPLADPVEPVVPRTGAPVELMSFGSTGEAIATIGEALRSLMLREKKANVAVVARYRAQADMYYDGLKKSEIPALRRVYGKEFSFSPGIDVVDVAQIKGLEYDYVVLVEVNANSYAATREARHLLHIAATRTVHQLWVSSVDQPSPLLPQGPM